MLKLWQYDIFLKFLFLFFWFFILVNFFWITTTNVDGTMFMILDPAKDFLKLFRKILEKISLESKLLINELGIFFLKMFTNFNWHYFHQQKVFWVNFVGERMPQIYLYTIVVNFWNNFGGCYFKKNMYIWSIILFLVTSLRSEHNKESS